MADNNSAGKRRVARASLEGILDCAARLLFALVESLFGARQMSGGLWQREQGSQHCLACQEQRGAILLTSDAFNSFGQPVEMDAWLSMQNAPQKTRRRSSSSVQSAAGSRVDATLSTAASSSRRLRPIMPISLAQRAQLMPARVKSIARASYVETRAHACAWATVMKCSPLPYSLSSHVRVRWTSNQD